VSRESTVRLRSEDERDDAKTRAAQVLDRAMRTCTKSNEDVRRMFAVTGQRVATLRSDDEDHRNVVPNIADLLLCDHDLAEQLLQEIRNERLKLHGEPPAVTPEQRLHRAMRRAHTFSSTTLDALENGVLESHEKPDIDRDRKQLIAELEALGPSLANDREAKRGT
jgi:hypothetical protein